MIGLLWANVVFWAVYAAVGVWFAACPHYGGPLPLAWWMPDKARTIRGELRPFILPAIVGGYFALVARNAYLGRAGEVDWLAAALFVGYVLSWWRCRKHDNDDRWRRRRRKAVDQVRELAGRLTIQPGEAS